MLSSRISSQPTSSSSRSCSRSVTSTSTRSPGWARRTASYAGTTPPAATTWLSLTMARSERLMRWLSPPPQRTAYFCRARHPGSVLRVSRTRALVPSSAATQAAVAVATPERWHAKLSAVRSAVSSPLVGPATRITTSPADTRLPSGTRSLISTSSPRTVWKTRAAIPSPATVPASRAAKTPAPRASAEIVATLVTSSVGTSSASARSMCAWTSAGSRPAAASSSRTALTACPWAGCGRTSSAPPARAGGRSAPSSSRRHAPGSPPSSATPSSPDG